MVTTPDDALLQPMDTAKLRTHVFEQTGIRIDTTDPVFALVALNDAVLAEGVERQRIVVDALIESISRQSDTLLDAGERYKRAVQRANGRADEAGAGNPTALQPRQSLLRTSLIVLCGALLSAVLTLCGLFFANKMWLSGVAPAAPRAPTPMTAEQILHMQNGEKFSRILPLLDAVTQARILELMRQ